MQWCYLGAWASEGVSQHLATQTLVLVRDGFPQSHAMSLTTNPWNIVAAVFCSADNLCLQLESWGRPRAWWIWWVWSGGSSAASRQTPSNSPGTQTTNSHPIYPQQSFNSNSSTWVLDKFVHTFKIQNYLIVWTHILSPSNLDPGICGQGSDKRLQRIVVALRQFLSKPKNCLS